MVVDREAYDGAAALIRDFGAGAVAEASARAEASRRRDNPFRFARWSRVRRTLLLLADPTPTRLLH